MDPTRNFSEIISIEEINRIKKTKNKLLRKKKEKLISKGIISQEKRWKKTKRFHNRIKIHMNKEAQNVNTNWNFYNILFSGNNIKSLHYPRG